MIVVRWWFGRRSAPDSSEGTSASDKTAPERVATFSGVSREEVLDAGTGLYEVISDAGVHVTLHETELVRLEVAAAPRAELTLWCRFDPDWVPAGAEATPVVRLHFTDVVVESMEVDEDGWDLASGSDAQVRLLDYAAGDWFRLQTWALLVDFRAAHADLSLHPAEPG
ncbi:hypothetical protein GTQ99_02590 [Kineococcus sp. T13]|uniref:hypothetical protein n=1 Tax=Kineococcus vitellinus TaxID=2696565 RepID=UPI001412112C|nr:hypothetical protein [Kineococcus vitellinus]NAZ74314.1 hypothetical protein [Kineococcus vitellinus]